MIENNDKIDEAVSALASATESFTYRIETNHQLINRAGIMRQLHVEMSINFMLPDVSKATLILISKEIPEFLCPLVQKSFNENRKLFGLFATKSYNHALSLLQMNLARHLERVQYGEIGNYNRVMVNLRKETSELNAKINDAMELVDLLLRSRHQQMPLPMEVLVYLNRINIAARRVGRSSSIWTPPGEIANDSDLWLEFMSEIPEELKRLLQSTAAGDQEKCVKPVSEMA